MSTPESKSPLTCSPPRINKFAKPPPSPAGPPIPFPNRTPKVSLLQTEAPKQFSFSPEPFKQFSFLPEQIPEPPKKSVEPTKQFTEPPKKSSKVYQKALKFLGKNPDIQIMGHTFWIHPGIYETVEIIDTQEFPLTVRLQQDLSPETVKQLTELFKTSWYEPRGIHGVQTDKMEKALERFLIAHYLEEGRLSYEDIRELKLRKKLEKDQGKYEKLLKD